MSETLETFSRRLSIPVDMHEELGGSVSVENAEGTVRDYLDALGDAANAVWWYDGTTVHLEPRASMTSELVYSRGLRPDAIRDRVAELGLADPRFPIHATGDGSVLRLSGPESYVAMVADVIDTLVERRTEQSAGAEPLPRIYLGRPAVTEDGAAAPAE